MVTGATRAIENGAGRSRIVLERSFVVGATRLTVDLVDGENALAQSGPQ